MVYAEDGSERESQEYDESRFDLMTYAENSWYEWADKTGTSAVSAIKNFLWQINMVIANITLMIVYQLFSLDVVELTQDSIMQIASGTAGSLMTNLGMFAFAIASLGIVIRAYVQQNWQAFFKIVTLVVLCMALLFSISSEKFNYVQLAHGISVSIENAVMQVNPSLTDSTDFEISDGNVGEQVSTQVENKAYQSLLFKPYLLLQYGSTNEEAINAEGSYNGEEPRIDEYLNTNPSTEEGMELREDIAEYEFSELNNENIFAGNAFKTSAYIMGIILSTTIQAIVFFFLALMRIMLQFAFIFLLILAPFMLFLSIFPTFEGLIGQYIKGSFMVILFKAGVMFLVLVSTSFIALSYDMADMSNDIYYRIFIQSIFSIAIIFMYMKRQFVFDMLSGANISLAGMGAGEGMGRASMARFRKGATNTKNATKKTASGVKKGSKVAARTIGKTAGTTTALSKRASDMYDQAGRYASTKAHSFKEKVGGKMEQTKDYIKQSQLGEVGPKENPYQTPQENTIGNSFRNHETNNVSHFNQERSQDKHIQSNPEYQKQDFINKQPQNNRNVTSINGKSKGQSMRNPHVAQKNLKNSSPHHEGTNQRIGEKSSPRRNTHNRIPENNNQPTKTQKNVNSDITNQNPQTQPFKGSKNYKEQIGRTPNTSTRTTGQPSTKANQPNTNTRTGRNPYGQRDMSQKNHITSDNHERTINRSTKENQNIKSNRGGLLHQRSLLHDDDQR